MVTVAGRFKNLAEVGIEDIEIRRVSEQPAAASQPQSTDVARVASVAMHSQMGDPAANLDRVEQWSIQAHQAGASFAVFPEECITGSLNKSDIELPEMLSIVGEASRTSVPRLESISRQLNLTLVVGTIERVGDKFRNGALIVGPQGYLATSYKLCLPNQDEREFFEPGDSLSVVTSQGWTFSVGICADLNQAEYFRAAAEHGAEFFLLAVGGSGKAELVGPEGDLSRQAEEHQAMHVPKMQERATENGIYVFYANQAGQSGNA